MDRFTFRLIPADQIYGEFPYSCRYRLQDPVLSRSISESGIKIPLLVTGSDKKTIIAGHKRYFAARELKIEQLPAVELAENPSPKDLFLLAAVSNWNQAWGELDRASTLLKSTETFHLSEKEIVDTLLPCLGLPSEKNLVDHYVRVMRLDPALLELIADQKMPFRGSQALSRFARIDQEEFARSIAPALALTTNQLLRVGEWLIDLLKPAGIGLKDLLETHGLNEVLNAPEEDKRRKTERFYGTLRKIRFPRLSEYEQKFEGLARAIGDEHGEFELEAPESFEDQGFVIRLKIRDKESLERVLSVLGSQKAYLNSLFDIML